MDSLMSGPGQGRYHPIGSKLYVSFSKFRKLPLNFQILFTLTEQIQKVFLKVINNLHGLVNKSFLPLSIYLP